MSEGANIYTYESFISAHKAQLEAASVPELYWESLFVKLANDIFDAGDYFQIVDDEGKLSVIATTDLDPANPNNIFLIDHAWTFRPQDARKQLENVDGLVDRMEGIMGAPTPSASLNTSRYTVDSDEDEVVYEALKKERVCDSGDTCDGEIDACFPRQDSVEANLCKSANDDENVNNILRKMWKHVQTYTVRYKQNVDEESMPLWYAMDEFGSRVAHSEEPNCRIVPLYFAARGFAYSLIFCLKEVKEDEELARDFADTVLLKQKPEWRPFLMLPWIDKDHTNASNEREKPDNSFYLSGRQLDELPSSEEQDIARNVPKSGGKMKIFADDVQLVSHLERVEFELVEDYTHADALWLMKHFHHFKDLCVKNPAALVNQFPYEGCLTVKDLLSAILMQSNAGNGPTWYQTCFNLNTELPQFVAHFQQRAKRGEDNTWIVKPWNLARGLDMHVTNNLAHIIRLIETGPKIVCKYIENPVLFRRPDTGSCVKFDLRFILFVNQLKPVKAHVYNKFWIRFAINHFTLTCLDDMETHFTVFNYGDKSKILQMECGDFVTQMESIYPNMKWSDVQMKINTVLRQLLEAASSDAPPCGVAPNAQSRAMYGVDIMLKWNDKAKSDVGVSVLECNFMPDCERACDYYPDFADTVFETLFLDKADPTKVTEI